MKTTIIYRTLKESNKIVIDDNLFSTINGEQQKLSAKEFNNRIWHITKNWEPYMINERILDGLHLEITIEVEGFTKKYICRNEFPDNFEELSKLLQEVKIW